MNPVFLAAFFTASIVGCTAAFVRIPTSDPLFLEWLGLFVLFVLYRSKIMVDDLGWYADVKTKGDLPNPVDVLFAVVTWIGWFMMAAVMGENLRYFAGLLIATFVASTIWIYIADATATNVTREGSRTILGLFLKDSRHKSWCWMNVLIVGSAGACYGAVAGWLPAEVFRWGLGALYVVLILDVLINRKDFSESLQKAK